MASNFPRFVYNEHNDGVITVMQEPWANRLLRRDTWYSDGLNSPTDFERAAADGCRVFCFATPERIAKDPRNLRRLCVGLIEDFRAIMSKYPFSFRLDPFLPDLIYIGFDDLMQAGDQPVSIPIATVHPDEFRRAFPGCWTSKIGRDV